MDTFLSPKASLTLEQKKHLTFTLIAYVNFYYSKWLRYPSKKQLAKVMGIKEESASFLLKYTGYNYKKFIEALAESSPNLRDNARAFITKTYIQTMEMNKREQDIAYYAPNLPDLAQAIKLQSLDISAETLSVILGYRKSEHKRDRLFPQGLAGVKNLAKQRNPKIFTNFLDSNIFFDQAEKFSKKITHPRTNGYVVSSVTSGIALDDVFFNNLMKFAEEKNLLVVLIPVNREAEFLPEVKVTKKGGKKYYESRIYDRSKKDSDLDTEFKALYELENVFVIVHDIHVTETFAIQSLPLMAKNFNPFASLNRVRAKNSVSIFGHPQLQAKVESTDGNNMFPTILLSSGSVSENSYPYKTHVSARLSSLASQVHKLGAWVFERPDRDAGINQLPAPGQYHFYPIYQHNIDTDKQGEIRGIIDNSGKVFTEDIERDVKVDLEYLVLGDLHIGNTSPKMYSILDQVLRDHPELKGVVLHDHFDGYSINHHEASNLLTQSKKIQYHLNLKEEHERNVNVINSILAMDPKLKIILIVSNHPNWLYDSLQNYKSYSDPINSRFLTEIKHAVETMNIEPFEYLYRYRRESHDQVPILAVKQTLLEKETYVTDPSRLEILKPGEPYYGGSQNHPVILHGHGHNYQGRHRGVSPSNAANIGQAVVGHTHSPGIMQDVVNVGTSTRLNPNYTLENLVSNWVNGLAFIFKGVNNPRLFIIPPSLEKYQAYGKPFNPKKHFEGGYPRILNHDNEKVSGHAITDQNTSDGKPIRRKNP